jgi:hypothetical protein
LQLHMHVLIMSFMLCMCMFLSPSRIFCMCIVFNHLSIYFACASCLTTFPYILHVYVFTFCLIYIWRFMNWCLLFKCVNWLSNNETLSRLFNCPLTHDESHGICYHVTSVINYHQYLCVTMGCYTYWTDVGIISPLIFSA